MMSEKGERGKKRSKAFYKKCAYGGKKQRLSSNVLEPGIKGFLVMCNHNEKSAVRESYNILNEYAGIVYGHKPATEEIESTQRQVGDKPFDESDTDDEDDDDVEKALKKEVEGIKAVDSSQKRFQNVLTKAKNCIFIRTTLEDPVEIISYLMEDIAKKKLRRARFAARILPIIGTCKANPSDIAQLAEEVLQPVFSPNKETVPESYTILFKSRNNSGSQCRREGVVSSLIKVVKTINPDIKFTWTDYSVAILVEIVCTICCIGVAPHFIRLRKYNLQELTKGAKTEVEMMEKGGSNSFQFMSESQSDLHKDKIEDTESDLCKNKSEDTESDLCKDRIEDTESDLCKDKIEDTESDLCKDKIEDTESDLCKERIEDTESDLCKDKIEDTESDLCKDKLEDTQSDLCKDKNEDSQEIVAGNVETTH